MTMYNIDKLKALGDEFKKEMDSKYLADTLLIEDFIRFIKEKENPFNPNQTVLKFEEDGE